MHPSKFFSKEDQERIKSAIGKAELNTSGEIRVHLERKCREEVLDHAAYLFEKLGMHKTEKRNGVLFYLAVDDRKFAILGDAGINAVTPDDFWDNIKEEMLTEFTENRFCEGLVKGIGMAGEKMQEHFPYEDGDIDELSDEISFGDQ
jgi:uncharacterized membrane protein